MGSQIKQTHVIYPIVSARPNDSAPALPSCLQAVLALIIVNPSIQIVAHRSVELSYISSLPNLLLDIVPFVNRKSPCCCAVPA